MDHDPKRLAWEALKERFYSGCQNPEDWTVDDDNMLIYHDGPKGLCTISAEVFNFWRNRQSGEPSINDFIDQTQK